MKLKVVVDLDLTQRRYLQSVIGKTKGIKPAEYKEALMEMISNHLMEESRKEVLRKIA